MLAKLYLQTQYVMLLLLLTACVCVAQEPPVIPVGLDAYRQWERWPYQRIGARAYMRSTYDRAGGNEGADASHFLYQTGGRFQCQPGCRGRRAMLYFVRTNHWHGSPWHYVVDGSDNLVQETSTAIPCTLFPTPSFCPPPRFPTLSLGRGRDTRGADLSWVPIAFTRIVSDGLQPHALRHGLLHLPPVSAWREAFAAHFAPGTSMPSLTATFWTLLHRAGTDIAPQPGTPDAKKRQSARGQRKRENSSQRRGDSARESFTRRDGTRSGVVRAPRTGACVGTRPPAHYVG